MARLCQCGDDHSRYIKNALIECETASRVTFVSDLIMHNEQLPDLFKTLTDNRPAVGRQRVRMCAVFIIASLVAMPSPYDHPSSRSMFK